MKANSRLSSPELRELLADSLKQVPFATVGKIESEPPDRIGRPDATAELVIDGKTWKLLIEQKASGQLRYIRDAVDLLKSLTRDMRDTYGLVVAPYISTAGSQLLREHGIGFLDRSGNCLLSFGRVFIEHTGNPNKFARGRQQNSLFTPKSSRILRALLTAPERAWRVTDLASDAEVSNALVTHVRKLLAEREWTVADTSKLKLSDPRAVLNEWSNNYTVRKNRIHRFYSLDAVADIEARLMEAAHGRRCRVALTGMSGAARYNAFALYKRVTAFCECPLEEVAAACNLKPVSSGENVWLLEPFDAGVFYGGKQLGGSLVVSPVQLYLDLFNMKGRGEEVAQMILESVLEKSW